MGEQIDTMQTNTAGTSSASLPAQSVPPRPRGIPYGLILISEAMWIEVMTKLAILEAKVDHMEGGIKPWLDTQFITQDR